MSLLPRFKSWFRAANARSRLERDMEEELAFHVESYRQELIRHGNAPEEAARRARIELGGIMTQKEKMRAALGLRLWDLQSGCSAPLLCFGAVIAERRRLGASRFRTSAGTADDQSDNYQQRNRQQAIFDDPQHSPSLFPYFTNSFGSHSIDASSAVLGASSRNTIDSFLACAPSPTAPIPSSVGIPSADVKLPSDPPPVAAS